MTQETNAHNPSFRGGEVIDKNITKWTNIMTGNRDDSNYWIVIRASGDENEWALFGHGWLGLGSGHKVDERDRAYATCKIPKQDFANIWKNFNGESIDIPFTPTMHSDNFGDAKGHTFFNNTPRCWDITAVTIRITAPLWSPTKAGNLNNSLCCNYRVDIIW